MAKRMLIFGISGFIGANLAEYFSRRGWHVTGVSRRTNWRTEALIKNKTMIPTNFIGFDITKYQNAESGGDLDNVFDEADADVVINVAAYGENPKELDPEQIYKTNVLGAINVTEAAIRRVNNPLVLNTGSGSEFLTNDAYAISKRLTAKYVSDRAKTVSGTKLITLRLFSPYGYYEDKGRLFPQILLNAMQNKPIPISNPEYQRNFTFIEDVCNAYDIAIERQESLGSGMAYNIASKPQSIRNVMETAKRMFDNLRFEMNAVQPQRELDRMKRQAMELNGNEEIGWFPKNELGMGMMKIREWMIRNRESMSRLP